MAREPPRTGFAARLERAVPVEAEVNAVVEHKDQLPAEGAATSILQVIERAARDSSVDVERMERLLSMHERMLAKQSESAFNEAMIAAQSAIRRIAADAENLQTKSQY